VTRHGVGGYRSGCRCPTCYQAESTRKRAQRERKLTGGTVARSRRCRRSRRAPRPSRSVRRWGDVEAAVPAEVEPLPRTPEYPGLVQAATRLAQTHNCRLIGRAQLIDDFP
jgi:hypothetical protein